MVGFDLTRIPGRRLLALGLLVLLNEHADAKFAAGHVRIGGAKKDNSWKYLSKFGYAVGEGRFQVRVQLHVPKNIIHDTNVKLEVYLDEDWDKVEAMEDLCSRKELARQTRDVLIDKEGQWSAWVNGSLHQSMRPHIWYFALQDCDNALQNFTHRIKYEFHAQQSDDCEFSVESRWSLSSNVICLFALSVFVFHCYTRAKSFFKETGVHPVVWTLATAIIMQYLAQLCHTGHLYWYRSDGKGLKGLEVISEILFMLSQVIQTSLLILIGLGYTLIQSKIGELDLMIPMCFMVAVIHIMLVGFGKIQDDASYKYHENEGAVGWVLLVMRLLLYAWFMWAVQSTAREGGMRLQQFCMQFRIAGSLYFLAYPLIFIITKRFAPYWQHCIMSSGLMLMQMGSNVWLASLFLRRSDYFKVSTLNSSFLPGGARVGVDKEE